MYQYRSEANRFDRDFEFEITKKSEHSFFLKTKGKKRKCSIMNYRSFAITRIRDAMANVYQLGPHVPKDKNDFHGKTGTRDGAKQLVTQLATFILE
jgi:hypothetical protein